MSKRRKRRRRLRWVGTSWPVQPRWWWLRRRWFSPSSPSQRACHSYKCQRKRINNIRFVAADHQQGKENIAQENLGYPLQLLPQLQPEPHPQLPPQQDDMFSERKGSGDEEYKRNWTAEDDLEGKGLTSFYSEKGRIRTLHVDEWWVSEEISIESRLHWGFRLGTPSHCPSSFVYVTWFSILFWKYSTRKKQHEAWWGGGGLDFFLCSFQTWRIDQFHENKEINFVIFLLWNLCMYTSCKSQWSSCILSWKKKRKWKKRFTYNVLGIVWKLFLKIIFTFYNFKKIF